MNLALALGLALAADTLTAMGGAEPAERAEVAAPVSESAVADPPADADSPEAPAVTERIHVRVDFLDVGFTRFDAISAEGSPRTLPAERIRAPAAGVGLFGRYRWVEAGVAAASTLVLWGANRAQLSLLAGGSMPVGSGRNWRCRVDLFGELGRAKVFGIGYSPFFGGSEGTGSATLDFAGARAGVSVRFNAPAPGPVLGVGAAVTHDLGSVTTSSDWATYRVGGLLTSFYLRVGMET